MHKELNPISSPDRIHILDILRGFAVFGILQVNIVGFSSPAFLPGYVSSPTPPRIDQWADYLLLFLAESKFYIIFSFLFGLGFAVQMARAEAKGRGIDTFYPRRLWVLFFIGILHSTLLWSDDILRIYALLGFALLAFRKQSNRTLLGWMALFFILSIILPVLIGTRDDRPDVLTLGEDWVRMARAAYQSRAYWDVLQFQTRFAPLSFLIILLAQGAGAMTMFLLGLLVGRSHFFERLAEHHNTLIAITLGGLLLWAAGGAVFWYVEDVWVSSAGYVLGSLGLASMYVALLSLASLLPGARHFLSPLASVGRMALSNYVFQSVVCLTIFSGFGLGQYEKIGLANLIGLASLIYVVQIILSVWWLKYFRFGPLEWVWRSLTYQKAQPFWAK